MAASAGSVPASYCTPWPTERAAQCGLNATHVPCRLSVERAALPDVLWMLVAPNDVQVVEPFISSL